MPVTLTSPGSSEAGALLSVIVIRLMPSQGMSVLRPAGSNRRPSGCVTSGPEFPDVPHNTAVEVTVTTVLITMFLFALSEPAEPGAGSVRSAALGLVTVSKIVPPLRLSAVVLV